MAQPLGNRMGAYIMCQSGGGQVCALVIPRIVREAVAAVADLIDRFVDSPWLTRLMILCTIGMLVNFAGLSVVVLLLSRQASQGQMAREVQQAKYPVSLRLYEDAFRRGVITAADLECFRDWRSCPPPKTP